MLLLICSLALRKPLHNPPCCFCLLARGRRCLKGAWILNDYGAEHHSWAALCNDTGKEWAFKTWNLLGVVYYSSEPVLSHMYSLGWNVIEDWLFVQILRKFRRGHTWFKEWIHGLPQTMAACTMSWVFKRQGPLGLCLWACFGGYWWHLQSHIGRPTMSIVEHWEAIFLNSLSLAFRTTIHTYISLWFWWSPIYLFFPSWLLKDHFPR